MFNNLDAEQKRKHLSNQAMANLLGISRTTYEAKKKTGTFGQKQIKFLLKFFNCPFEYLFATEEQEKPAS